MANYAEQLGFTRLEQQYGLPPGLLQSVMMAESSGDPSALSPKGAQGLFQFMPETAKSYGINPYDPAQAASGAARMFGDLSKQYGGDIPLMLAGYNWGSGNLARQGVSAMPQETRDYIAKVMGSLPAGDATLLGDAGSDNLSDAQLDTEIARLEAELASPQSEPTDAEIDAEIAALEAELGQSPPGDAKTDGILELPPSENASLTPQQGAQAREGIAKQVGSFLVGQADARSFGFGDEIASGIGALPALLSDKMTYGEAYDKNIARIRAGQEKRKEEQPGSYLAGQLYGGIKGAGALAGTRPAKALANSLRTGEVFGRNLGLLGRAGKVGLAGAVPSGLYGFASGQGVDDRIARAEREGATGAAIGAAIPVAGAALSKVSDAVVPRIDEALKPLVKRAQEMGVPLRLDQVAPSRVRSTIQKVSQEIPLSGVDAFETSQRRAWNQAVANRALGAPDLSPEGINSFLDRMDDAFKTPLKGKTISIPAGGAFMRKLDDIATEIPKNVANDVAAVVKANIDDVLGNITDGKISGTKLASVRSTLLNRLKSADSRAKPYIGDLIEAIDDTVQGQIGKDAAKALGEARKQWRNYRTIEPLLEKATDGEINPTELLNRVANSKYIKASRAITGKDDLVDLARIGKQFLPKRGGSDTFQKAALGTGASGLGYLALTNPPVAAAVAGKAAAGVGANRAYQSLYNQSPALLRMAAEKPSQQRIGYEELLRLIEQ